MHTDLLAYSLIAAAALKYTAALFALLISGSGILIHRHGLGLEEGEMSRGLAITHEEESQHYKDPVQVVRDDGAVSGRVLPAEDGVEDTPAAASVELWVAELRRELVCTGTRVEKISNLR